MADKQLRVVIVGDAKSVQKAFADTGTAATQAEVKVEGFGKSFAKTLAGLGGAAALGARAANVAVDVVRDLSQAVDDYQKKMQSSQSTILGVTQDQSKLTEAFAFAENELQAGRAAYSDTVAAIAELTPTAKRTGQDVTELYRTVQLLGTLNSGPGGGVEGALIAINEALAGQYTSLQRRFNISTDGIRQAVEAGVPPLKAIQDALAQSGVTMDLVNAKAKDLGNQEAIAKDQAARLAAEVGKPIFTALAQGLTNVNKQLSSGEWAKYAQEYQQFVSLLIKSLTSWKALSGVGEQLGIQIEKGLLDTLLGIPHVLDQAAYGLAASFSRMFGISEKAINEAIAKVKGLDPLNGLYDAWTKKIAGDQSKLDNWFKDNFADPLADAAQGKTDGGSSIAPAKMQGYGAAAIEAYTKGLTSAQIGGFDSLTKQINDQFKDLFSTGDVKADADAVTAANSLIAESLQEIATDGQISETTFQRLSTVYGKSTAQVQELIVAYARMGEAQDHAKATTEALAAAQGNLTRVQAQAANAAADADKAIASATQTAKDHADAATEAIEREQDALSDLGKEAAAVARADQAAIDGLQATAAAHAEENQRAIAEAQAAQTAASAQRQRDSAIAQAAINGETEAYERQTEGLTDQDRALAQHYETIIGGERRAKDAADERLNGLNHAANKEDLDFLTRIQAARQSGNAKEANALQRQYDARKKQRGTEMEIARAQAAVAGDNFDDKAKQIDKEEKKKDEADATAEKVAGKRVAEVQAQADAQAKADAAAIKGAQDAATADADRYAAQQRGIQDEIDKLGDAAKAQAKKDADAITALQTQKTETALKWSIDEAGAKVSLGLAGQIATANERIAAAAKETYDKDVARAPYAKENADNAEREAAARQVGATIQGQRGGTQGDDNGQNDGAPLPVTPYAPPAAATTPQPTGAPNLPPLKDGNVSPYPPAGYYEVLDSNHHRWYVPYGYRLSDYGIQEAGQSTGGASGGNDAGSLGRAGSSNLLRESGSPATAGGGVVVNQTFHITAGDLGSVADRQALVRELGNHSLRAWNDVQRGGPPQGVV